MDVSYGFKQTLICFEYKTSKYL